MNSALSKPIQSVVFAEGGSLRLRPLTEHLPTCLVPVAGTPILDHQLQALFRLGLKRITVVGGYRAIQVEQACRPYAGVRFQVNSRFSRGEPHRSSLVAANLDRDSGCLLIRGDLVFEDALIRKLLDAPGPDAHLVGPNGRGVGLYRLSPDTLRPLLEGSTTPGAEYELFPAVEALLAQKGSPLTVEGHAWARVATMEDLARALKAGRDSRSARVAETQERLQQTSNAEASVPPSSTPPAAAIDPALPALGMGSMSRTLLRVFPR